jgi:NAD+ diphosphatase
MTRNPKDSTGQKPAMIFIPGRHPHVGEGRGDLWFLFRQGKLLIKKSQDGGGIPTGGELTDAALGPERKIYFGALDGRPCYAAALDRRALPEGLKWVDLRALFGSFREELLWVAGRANQLVDWDQGHRFCGSCGRPTEDKADERAKRCPSCNRIKYPRLSPAVIVAVLKGDQILLARNKRFRIPMFSVLAGFVEPGETLEACVAREIREESGIEVKNIRYFGSQPWPFPDSLMIAFVAEYAGGEIRLDGDEIAEAGWFSKSNLPPIPSTVSIARRLIDWFVDSP